MSNILGTGNYMVGDNLSYQSSSKSMLSTIKIDNNDAEDQCIISNNFIVEKSSLKTGSGIEIQQKNSIVPSITIHNHKDSIINFIDTGFGECKTIEKVCPKPTFKSHLYKENYLNEFKTETEKALIRNHLGIYGKSETIALIKQEIDNCQSFIKKEEVKEMITNLDFVNSTLKAFVDYQIPEKLFKL